MSLFKFTPDLMSHKDLETILVGRKVIIKDIIRKIENAAEKRSAVHIVVIGQRGIGKTHLLLTIYHHFKNSPKIYPIRLSEEEYSVTRLEELFERILQVMNVKYDPEHILEEGIKILKAKRKEGRTPVVFVDNLQLLFSQLESDLPKLRAILQEHNPFCILGSALSVFDAISRYNEPFYEFFEMIFLRGLSQSEVGELIEKRLRLEGKEDMVKSLHEYKERIKGIQILTGGNPRLIHSLCEILIRKGSFQELEQNLLELLDQLTPYYQARIEALPIEKRKLVDTLALSDGPLSPTELAKKASMQTNIVVTQLRRLENDGFVEPVKFRDKRTTMYQVSERLYRIWREMRSPIGLKRISLFIEFLKIWYTTRELYSEFRQLREHIDKVIKISTMEARKSLIHMCYVLETLPALQVLHLPTTVANFMMINDLESANEEISKVKIRASTENNLMLKSVLEVEIILATIVVNAYTKGGETDILTQNLLTRLETVEKNIATTDIKDNKTKFWLHEVFYTTSSWLMQHNKYKEAEKYNNLSLHYADHSCATAMIDRAKILTFFDREKEALKVLDKLVSLKSSNEAIALRMIANSNLKRRDSALRDADYLIKNKALLDDEFLINHLPALFHVYSRHGKYTEAVDIVKHNEQRINKLEIDDRKFVIPRLADEIIHSLGHAILEEKVQVVDQYLALLRGIKESIEDRDVVTFMKHNLVRFSSDKNYAMISKLIRYVQEVLGEERIEALKPIIIALEFIQTGNTDILEKLHKESRELVIDIINSVAPDVVIPQKVYESL